MRLNPFIDILRDPAAALTTAQAEKSPDFAANHSALDSLGFSNEALWLRFRLAREAGGPREVLLEVAYPLLDEVSLTLVGPEGRRTMEAGDALPFAQRTLHYANPTFAISLPESGTVFGLLRLHTSGSLQFPLRLWAPAEYAGHSANVRFLYGLFYGAFLVLSALAVVVFLFTRDTSFLLYGCHLASYALLQFSLNGFAEQYFWPYGGSLPSRLPPVLAGTTMFLMLAFSSRVLGFWPNSRVLRGLFGGLALLSLVIVVLGILGPPGWSIRMATWTGVFLLPALLAGAAFSLRRGVFAARYFVVAWTLALTAASITVLTLLGLLPSNVLTLHAMQIGASLAVWILSLALLDRLRTLRQQKDKAVAEAHRYLHQLNEELEALVAERTRELEVSNARLRDVANRDSLTGLLNHRTCVEGVADLLELTVQRQQSLAVIMLDIDHFKSINDRFGHQRGDQVLRLVAEVLSLHTRAHDVCGRYGGEEFLLAVAAVDQAGARRLAERLRLAIGAVSPEDWWGASLSASLGVALTVPGEQTSAATLIGRADEALYAAKRNGRNRMELAPALRPLASVVSVER
jgi:diguanylate cyclase (GGDEF)-like protein